MKSTSRLNITHHNSADSVPTSNLVSITEVAIRTTFSHMISIAGIIYYTHSLVVGVQCIHYENAFNKLFDELCVKTILLESVPNEF